MTERILHIKSNKEIKTGIFEMTLSDDNTMPDITAGQFANLSIPNRRDLLLKRPFGITKLDTEKNTITVCYQLAGEGTKALSMLKTGEKVSTTYPLGNGFKLDESHKKVMLIGGGVGVFPLLPLLKQYDDREFYCYLGYANKDVSVYANEFESLCKNVKIATNDGSLGYKGFVTDLALGDIEDIKPDIILSCGPKPMFKSLYKISDRYPNIPIMVSLEERMGCGIGACLVCVCKVQQSDGIKHKRVCHDGPVFNLMEVKFDD